MHVCDVAEARKLRGDQQHHDAPLRGQMRHTDNFVGVPPPPPPRPSMSPNAAARLIQSRHGGRVLAVQPDGSGYRVKMLKEGEVRIYQVDP